MLDCEVLSATVEIDYTDSLDVEFGTMRRTFDRENRKISGNHGLSKFGDLAPW